MASAPTTTMGATPPGSAPSGVMPTTPGGAQPQRGQQGSQGPQSNQNNGAQAADNNKSLHEKGRSKIHWSREVWERIDHAVEQEVKRTRIGARFLPKKPVPPKTTSVPTDSYNLPTAQNPALFVDEGATIRICEYYVEFELTPQQVDQEEAEFKLLGHSTAVTLATKAANTLAQAEDLIIFQGQNAMTAGQSNNGLNIGSTLFTAAVPLVLQLNDNEPTDTGLLNFPSGTTNPNLATAPGNGPLTLNAPAPIPVLQVPQVPNQPGVLYGSNTFSFVSQAYSQLQSVGHYGPYALVLETIPYADTYAPLSDLTVTADRIKPLMTAGFFGSGTLPPNPSAPNPQNPPPALQPPFYGLMVSLGGNTMDVVIGLEPMAAFMQEDVNGNFRFRVLERFALRVKDPTAIVILQFMPPAVAQAAGGAGGAEGAEPAAAAAPAAAAGEARAA